MTKVIYGCLPEVPRGLVRVEVPPAAVVAVVADHEVPRPQPRVAVLVDAAAVEARRAVIHGAEIGTGNLLDASTNSIFAGWSSNTLLHLHRTRIGTRIHVFLASSL